MTNLLSNDELERLASLSHSGGKGDPQRDVRRLLQHIDAMKAARATPEGQEPVAWLVEWSTSEQPIPWVMAFASELRAIETAKRRLGKITPLYAAPQPTADHIGDTADMVDAQGVRDAWQPIETAPRDGTEVLLWATRHSMLMPHPERVVGAYSRGWWSGSSTLSHVTHWQPLPAPPQKPVSDEVKP